jgi:hypothetical protein
MRKNDTTIFRVVIFAGVFLLCAVCIQPCSADGGQLQVTATSGPALRSSPAGVACAIQRRTRDDERSEN